MEIFNHGGNLTELIVETILRQLPANLPFESY